MYLRTALVPVSEERKEECRRIYRSVALPSMRGEPGCLFAYCWEPVESDGPWLVMTAWEDKAAADNYGKSATHFGLFDMIHPLQERDATYREYVPIE